MGRESKNSPKLDTVRNHVDHGGNNLNSDVVKMILQRLDAIDRKLDELKVYALEKQLSEVQNQISAASAPSVVTPSQNFGGIGGLNPSGPPTPPKFGITPPAPPLGPQTPPAPPVGPPAPRTLGEGTPPISGAGPPPPPPPPPVMSSEAPEPPAAGGLAAKLQAAKLKKSGEGQAQAPVQKPKPKSFLDELLEKQKRIG